MQSTQRLTSDKDSSVKRASRRDCEKNTGIAFVLHLPSHSLRFPRLEWRRNRTRLSRRLLTRIRPEYQRRSGGKSRHGRFSPVSSFSEKVHAFVRCIRQFKILQFFYQPNHVFGGWDVRECAAVNWILKSPTMTHFWGLAKHLWTVTFFAARQWEYGVFLRKQRVLWACWSSCTERQIQIQLKM